MEKRNILRRLGLFDAAVPRYTSYPPANHFGVEVGHRNQRNWLQAVPDGAAVSLYIHIPFCKRLCWFCACRTQGTKTLAPVENYVRVLMQEIAEMRALLPDSITMSRLHFGGGTPTLLPGPLMEDLLDAVFSAFTPAPGWEFSIEIDPTEVTTPLLQALAARGLSRASIGVQDFAPEVQDAIGRQQSVEQTRRVTETLKDLGVANVNFDLLYGLPHQTPRSFEKTLETILELEPTRLAIYGYAHVPWMSKRQIMIPETALPGPETRFDMAEMASAVFQSAGFSAIGIDHFALPDDGLARAQETGQLRRNFQGYTDDTADTLIGLGASAISRFQQGYSQNAVSTSAYLDRIARVKLAGHKGFEMSAGDRLRAYLIEMLMCQFRIDTAAATAAFPAETDVISRAVRSLRVRFNEICLPHATAFEIAPEFRAITRIVAAQIDKYVANGTAHSAAI